MHDADYGHSVGAAGLAGQAQPCVEQIDVRAYTVPTDRPESDGTLSWDSTTIIVVLARSEGLCGLGYTYTDASAARLIESKLAPVVQSTSAMAPQPAWWKMNHAVRNIPACGLATFAISAIDSALWDLKARLLDLPLVTLLGQEREQAPIYGSGGFTSYSVDQLQQQLAGWVEQGIPRVKMKVGRHPDKDADRVHAARQAIGPEAELFVDANGAYAPRQAIALAHRFARDQVCWFEEPRPSDDPLGLAFVRQLMPANIEVAGGEYTDTPRSVLPLIDARSLDVIQPDITRCGGVSGLMHIAALCDAHHLPMSMHCAPALSMHAACAIRGVRHIEYFHDHVRLEDMLFEGTPRPEAGALRPDLSRPGNGLELNEQQAARWSA